MFSMRLDIISGLEKRAWKEKLQCLQRALNPRGAGVSSRIPLAGGRISPPPPSHVQPPN